MISSGFDIVSGPSREQLFDALRLVHEERTVRFEWIRPDDNREAVHLKILAIRALGDEHHAPKGGQSWEVHAYEADPDARGDRNILLLYSTQSRTGSIEFGASDIVGLSPLPVDDIPQEGLFVLFSVTGEFTVLSIAVDGFEDTATMQQFSGEWRDRVVKANLDVAVTTVGSIPGYVTPIRPAQVSVVLLKMLSDYLEDEDDEDDDLDDE